MKRVILESPYAGDVEENVQYARRCLLDSLQRGEAPMASHLLYPQCLDDTNQEQRKKGLTAGFEWIPVSDYSVIYVDRGISPGVRLGIEEAQGWFKPIEYRRLDPLPNPFYILISGKRFSGKDTLATLLQKKLRMESIIFGFAHILKHTYAYGLAPSYLARTSSSQTIHPKEGDIIYQRLLSDYAFKQDHRPQLIALAKEDKERCGEPIWVQRLLECNLKEPIIIIPDLRFKYEAQHPTFTRVNSLKLRVQCSTSTKEQRGWKYDSVIDEDLIEKDLDDCQNFDMILPNDGTIQDLQAHLDTILKRWALL